MFSSRLERSVREPKQGEPEGSRALTDSLCSGSTTRARAHATDESRAVLCCEQKE